MLLQLSAKVSKSFSLETMTAGRALKHNASRRTLILLLGVALLFLMSPATGRAQSIQYTQNKPDQGLRSAMRVDPTTLGLSIDVPIASYPGRDGTSVPINLAYSSKVWRINYYDSFFSPTGSPRTESNPMFSEWAKSGWSTDADIPLIEWTGHNQLFNDNGLPDCESCSQAPRYYINRIQVHMPGGASHELRLNDTPSLTLTYAGTYYAVDGSNLRYDAASFTDGILYLPDGSHYVLQYSTSTFQYVNRNGNTLSYNLANRQWTDTQGRVLDVPLPATPSATTYTYNLPTTTGTPASYSVRWSTLQDALTNSSDTLRYTTNMTFATGESFNPRSPSLFQGDGENRLYDQFPSGVFNPIVLAEIVLPNGQHYLFTYNVFGEITKVVYPTGAYERFDYAAVVGVSFLTPHNAQGNRGVVDRWLSPTGNSSDELHWHYSASASSFVLTVSTTAPDNTVSQQLSSAETSDSPNPFGFSLGALGMPFEDRVYAPTSAGGAMLRRMLTAWTASGPVSGGYASATRNPRATKKVEILLDTLTTNALTSTKTMTYDDDLNVIATNTYDFYSISQSSAQTLPITSITAGSLLRIDETTFLVNDTSISETRRASYRDRNLLGLPTSTRIKTGSETLVAQTKTGYDNIEDNEQPGAYPLLTYGGGTTAWSDPGNIRGLATTNGIWLNTTGSYLLVHTQYDQFGNMRNTWDGNGDQTQVTYSSSYSYAYPTTRTTPVPDPTGVYGSTTSLSSTTIYNANTGLMTSMTDANGQTTTYTYDGTNRQATMTQPTGGGSTTYTYGDTPGNLFVRTQTSLDSTRTAETYQYYDKLGRASRTSVNEGNLYLITDTEYNSMGAVARNSDTYRASSPTAETPVNANWTTYGYDYLGRVTSVTTSADGAAVQTAYSGNTSAPPLGPVVTVTDQAGKLKRSVMDALGRLARVDEPDNSSSIGSLGTLDSPQQSTSYSYDLLGNLLTVTQGSQTRTFVYDSLSRLQSATNPESGTVCYGTVITGVCQANGYDANGNLLFKTDARLVLSTYTYDALNRNISVTYSNDPVGTPALTRFYDGATNGKGRPWKNETAGATASRTTVNGYDSLGRVTSQSQQFFTSGAWTQPFTVGAAYTLSGRVVTLTYPSGHTTTNTYDSVDRTNSLAGNLGGAQRTYTSEMVYSEFGGLTKEKFGTDTAVYNKTLYNSRGQLAEIRVSTSYTGPTDTTWDRGAIINHYSNQGGCWGAACNASDNNGNLRRQELYIPRLTSGHDNFAQFYDYDSLNRLQTVAESLNGGSLQWQQKYVYDRYGNRTINTGVTETFGGVNSLDFELQTASNRLYAPGDLALTDSQRRMQYDATGNLKRDTYTGAGDRVFDAEQRMTKAFANGQWQEYTYDANGRRVRRKADGVETWQVYGIGGELLTEYALNAAPSSPQKEYGYRNGQLLVTAGVTAGWGAAPELHDNPLVVNETAVQARHITELRTLIDAVRSHLGSSAYAWQQSAAVGGLIKADPILEMRTALDQVLGAPAAPGYAAGLAQGQPIKAVHIQELRDRALAAWAGGSGDTAIDWVVTDQLGTPRMVIDKTGSLSGVRRHDYLPFGEDLGSTGGRTTTLGYNADSLRQKFTQKERDSQTGLDYFVSRYYASSNGRFTSPDSYNIIFAKERGGDEDEQEQLLIQYISQPQVWNKYAYVLNNPLGYIDPDGRREQTAQEKQDLDRMRQQQQEALKKGNKKLASAIGRAIKRIEAAIAASKDKKHDPAGLKIALFAIHRLGNTKFGKNGTVSFISNKYTVTVGTGSWKCNIFVAASQALGGGFGLGGNGVPATYRYKGIGWITGAANVPDANTWASQDRNAVANYGIVGTPSMGDAVAWPNPDMGHSGISLGDDLVIYAGERGVKIQTVDYVTADKGTNPVFRRHKP